MKLELHSTDRLVDVNGARCRVWHGVTEDGVECVAFITRVAVRADAGRTRLDEQLLEQPAPSSGPLHQAVDALLGDRAIDARLVR